MFYFIKNICTIILLITLIINTVQITPKQFDSFIKLITFQHQLQLKIFELGQTVNGNKLIAYGVTEMKQDNIQNSFLQQNKDNLKVNNENLRRVTFSIQKQKKLSNAVILTSLFHPRQINTILLLQQLLQYIIQNKDNSQQIKYLLQNSYILVFPFVNIDGYLHQQSLQNIYLKGLIRKNMNFKNYIKCNYQYQNGVDINRNFDSNYGKLITSSDPCGQQYRGQHPFSEKEAQAVKKLFQMFSITLAIDIHSYGNQWIYPYAFDSTASKVKQHFLYPQYQYIEKILKQKGQKVLTCYESLSYIADGVYIDWALDQGAFTFAYQFGNSFLNDKNISQQINKIIPKFVDVLKMNSFNIEMYKKDNKLYIKSNSLIDLSIKLNIKREKNILNNNNRLLYRIPARSQAFLIQNLQNFSQGDQLSFSVISSSQEQFSIENFKKFSQIKILQQNKKIKS